MLRQKAKALFQAHNPYPGPALENHNLRIARFTQELARLHGVELHHDLIEAGCYLHDIGLLIRERRNPNYLERGLDFVEPYAHEWALRPEDREVLRGVMLYNHSLRSVPGLPRPADLVRRAVQVEHSKGWVSHGLSRRAYSRILDDLPRHDLNSILLDFARITLTEDGPGQLYPIFFPGFPRSS